MAMNTNGDKVGNFMNGATGNSPVGFYNNTIINYSVGTNDTALTGINNSGQAVGTYSKVDSTPKCNPSAHAASCNVSAKNTV